MAVVKADKPQKGTVLPACPICHRKDQVCTMHAAYARELVQFQPPDLPEPKRKVKIWPWAVGTTILFALVDYYVFVQMGGGGTFRIASPWFQVLQVAILIILLTASLLSVLGALWRMVNSEKETLLEYPAWEEATKHWQALFYCQRDAAIFDGKQQKVLSNSELQQIRTVSRKKP